MRAIGSVAAATVIGGLAALALALTFPRAARSNFEFGLLYTITRYDQALPLVGLGFAIAKLPQRMALAGLILFLLGIPGGGLVADAIAHVLADTPWLLSGMFLIAPVCCALVGTALVAPAWMAAAPTLITALLSGAALGLVISFDNPSAAQQSFAIGAVVSGLWLTVLPLVLWRQFQRPWFPIAGRIFGAWLIAIGALLIASQLVPRPPPSEPPSDASPPRQKGAPEKLSPPPNDPDLPTEVE